MAWGKAKALLARLQSYGNQRTQSQQCSSSCDEVVWSEHVLGNSVIVRSEEVRVCTERSKLC